MFQVLKNFANSEKAIASGVLVAGATAFVFLGRMSIAEWQEYTLWALGIYTGGKTVQGGISAATGHKAAKEEARAHAEDAKSARKELAKLKGEIAANDAAADEEIDKKFGKEGEE